ncbi:zwei Ig domain protein zig-2-like [Panonychus citri]|uniref:zwei Ig domain protein zig-2-like n=1 Tax=Panonychus citri TaxID=50023 RepID=UPI002307D012|nr:zwei Ig domain protein zig-2-like [Panonychus citri]
MHVYLISTYNHTSYNHRDRLHTNQYKLCNIENCKMMYKSDHFVTWFSFLFYITSFLAGTLEVNASVVVDSSTTTTTTNTTPTAWAITGKSLSASLENGGSTRPESNVSSLPTHEAKNNKHFLEWVAIPKKSYHVNLFSHVSIVCSAVGNPAPRVYWYRYDKKKPVYYSNDDNVSHFIDNQRLTQNQLRNLSKSSQQQQQPSLNLYTANQTGFVIAKLFIPIITGDDTGEEFHCIADNGLKKKDRKVYLKVSNSPDLLTASHDSYVQQVAKQQRLAEVYNKPKIVSWTMNSTGVIGNDALLRCRHNFVGGTVVNWRDHNNVEVENFNRFIKLPSGDLLIRNVSLLDIGSYKCSATNGYGWSTVESFLYPVFSSSSSSIMLLLCTLSRDFYTFLPNRT